MTARSSPMFVREVRPYVALFRDPKTGIAWVEDGTTGLGHTAHANIASSGSVAQMKRRGFWNKEDRAVRSHGFIYNIDSCIVSNDLDRIARDACRCGGAHKCDDPVLAYKDRVRERRPAAGDSRPRRTLTVFEKHRLKIARDTLRMPDAILGVMGGGMTKEQARKVIRELTGREPNTR
jgi:hypothetical protein